MTNQYRTEKTAGFNVTHFFVRLIVGTVVLAITAALTPGFSISNAWSLILGAVVLAVLDYFAATFLKIDASPFGKGISGFILAAAIIYLTQYFVSGFSVTMWGALLGALIYGVVDAIIPGRAL